MPPMSPTVARFLLDGPVLPLVTDTVRVAEAFRAAAMSRFNTWCHQQPPARVDAFRRAGQDDRFASPVLSVMNDNYSSRPATTRIPDLS